jgi:hypothetical protein
MLKNKIINYVVENLELNEKEEMAIEQSDKIEFYDIEFFAENHLRVEKLRYYNLNEEERKDLMDRILKLQREALNKFS